MEARSPIAAYTMRLPGVERREEGGEEGRGR